MIKQVFIIIATLTTSISTIAQTIYKGKVAIYNDRYDMSKIESYVRIDNNGGLLYNRTGFINFGYNYISFGVGKTDSMDEIYMKLDFESESIKNTGLFSPEVFGTIRLFPMLNKDKEQVSIQYFSFRNPTFRNKNAGIFVITVGEMMYIMETEKDISEELRNLYVD